MRQRPHTCCFLQLESYAYITVFLWCLPGSIQTSKTIPVQKPTASQLNPIIFIGFNKSRLDIPESFVHYFPIIPID